MNQALSGTGRILSEIGALQRSITSGRRVEKPSDDPAAAGGIAEASSRRTAMVQYEKNMNTARARLAVEEGVLDQLTQVLTRVKELAVAQGGSASSQKGREAAQKEVDQLRELVVGLGNTRFAGSYLFGGDYADSRPFSMAGSDPTRPPVGDYRVEAGPGSFVAGNHSGKEILVDTGILDVLEGLSTALGSNDTSQVQALTNDLDEAFQTVQVILAEVGGRTNRIDGALEKLDAMEVELEIHRSQLQDTDLEEAITAVMNRQVTYQSAMLANSRILSLTLTDYLR